MRLLSLISLLSLILLTSCNEEAVPTTSTAESGITESDLVVVNTSSDSVVLLDSQGNFKKVLLQLSTNLQIPYGVAWSENTSEIIVSIDGTPDELVAINAETGEKRSLNVSGLNGTIRGVTIAENGDIIVIESNNLERYTIDGTRVTDGWPVSVQTTAEAIYTTSEGNIILCSRGSDVVGVYDDDGALVAGTKASGIASTTDCYGAAELGNGDIAVAWSGTTDTVSIYSSDLSSDVNAYNSSDVISNPRGVTPKYDGTGFYVVDYTYSSIVEFENDGTYVQTILPGTLSLPNQMISIPSF